MGKRAGTYDVLNVWRLEASCWHDCRCPSDRLLGRRAECQWRAKRWWEWWPRNRRPGEVDKRFTNEVHPDVNTAAQKAWFMSTSDKLAYAVCQRGKPDSFAAVRWVSCCCRTCVSCLRLQTLARTGQRYRKNGRLVHATTPRALGSEVCPACWRGESRA